MMLLLNWSIEVPNAATVYEYVGGAEGAAQEDRRGGHCGWGEGGGAEPQSTRLLTVDELN